MSVAAPRRSRVPLIAWFKDPWRRPRVLASITWLYIVWTIVPVGLAILFSFNAGRSRSSWQGFSLHWWVPPSPQDTEALLSRTDLTEALVHGAFLAILTALISVPLGVLFAIGIDRWRGRGSGSANFAMLFSFVIPELIIGVALYLLFSRVLRPIVPLGSAAQLIGLITFQISYPVIIVRARMLSIGKEYEEAAMDLGATPGGSVRRVLLPLLYPAIFASFAIVFADAIDDFITVSQLAGGADTTTLSMAIYSLSRASPTPAVNSAATVQLVGTLVIVTIGLLLYRRFSRGASGGDVGSFAQI